MPALVIDIGLGLAIGLALGLLGGGGSILTVPALVYIVGQSPQAAVTASLMIVGTNSALGALFHRSQGAVNWRVALAFGGAGMVMSYLAAGWSKLLPNTVLMILFASLMLIVGAVMLFSKPPQEDADRKNSLAVTVAAGAVVGIVTGFLGVGGGFLIVPALVLLVGVPMRQAVGTSLVVIAMNSLAGFLGHLDAMPLDFTVIGIFAAAGIVGTFIGARVAHHINPDQLRRLFAAFVIVLALFLLADNVGQLLSAVG